MFCSVVIPTYNRQESLCRTLNGFTRQSVSNAEFEVVVVSDGSTDETDGVLSEFASSRRLSLRWFSQDNTGPAAARNLGVQMARGDVIVFIDDDVVPTGEFLKRHLEHHRADEQIVVIGPLSPDPRWVREEPAWIAWEHAKLQSTYDMFKSGGRYAGCDAGYEHFYSGNTSVRKKWLTIAGGFDTEFKRQEDVELASRLKRLCDLRFRFDFAAEALHHPVRSLESWLSMPVSYGGLDARRVAAASLDESVVAELMSLRHGGTRILTKSFASTPGLVEPASKILCGLAGAMYAGGARSGALAILSAVYNARYAAEYGRVRSLRPVALQAAALPRGYGRE